MTTWTQTYDPLHNIWLSAIIAFVPILVFFLALMVWKLKGYLAAMITVILSLIMEPWAYRY